MFTIQVLCNANILASWSCPDDQLALRQFYHSNDWLRDFNALPNGYRGRNKLSAPIPVRERLAALINCYADGTPRARLARPYGEGSEPIWRRMRPPNAAVVEFCTYDTRTFGFFSRQNVFVAHRVVLADDVKDENRYATLATDTLRLMRRLKRSEIDGESDVNNLVTDG